MDSDAPKYVLFESHMHKLYMFEVLFEDDSKAMWELDVNVVVVLVESGHSQNCYIVIMQCFRVLVLGGVFILRSYFMFDYYIFFDIQSVSGRQSKRFCKRVYMFLIG